MRWRLITDAYPDTAVPDRMPLAFALWPFLAAALAGLAAAVVWAPAAATPASDETGLIALLAPGATFLVGAIGRHERVRETTDFDPARAKRLIDEIGAETTGELVEVFLGDAQQRLAAMRRFAAAGERKPLERAAHSIKSSAGTFGFERVAALACEIESQAAAAPEARLVALVEAAAEALGSGSSAWRAISRPTA